MIPDALAALREWMNVPRDGQLIGTWFMWSRFATMMSLVLVFSVAFKAVRLVHEWSLRQRTLDRILVVLVWAFAPMIMLASVVGFAGFALQVFVASPTNVPIRIWLMVVNLCVALCFYGLSLIAFGTLYRLQRAANDPRVDARRRSDGPSALWEQG